jgi:nucleoside-diphosphate-sugar epimerase
MSEYFEGKSVLLTGAAGFVGSHLSDRLIHDGARVLAVDNFAFSRPDWSDGKAPPGLTWKKLDIRNAEEVRGAFEQAKPDVVFHLAAVANPRTCKQDFPTAFDVNIVGTQNLFRFAPAEARFLFMSSAAVYGPPEYLPIDEAHPRRGSDPYSVTKIVGEDLATSYAKNYGRNVVIVRNFNSFGVGQTGDYIVPQLVRQAITDKKIELWDPSTVRDLMYIEDTVDALTAVAASPDRSIVNVGSGRGLAVGELAKLIAERVGPGVEIVDLHKKVIGSPALVANNERLRALGWNERVGLELGVDRTISWTRAALAAAH